MLKVGLSPVREPATFRRSNEMFHQACRVMPGGVTANIKYFSPHPIVMKEGRGSKLYDVDGNAYIDYMLCYGALITGHGHPAVYDAVWKQLQTAGTTIFGAPHELEIAMAEKLIEHYPGIEMVRFTNSGLEATLLAIRLAVAYTGKRKIAKFEGHYHGGYNRVLLSVNPHADEAGEVTAPAPVPESKGIDDDDLAGTIILPFNDLEQTEAILRAHRDDVAAVIMEPVAGGFIPATMAFMRGLRQLTEELGIVLIFDEVKTGFRVSLGGAQKVYGVKPDLTALGKVLGGGFPVGAVGGNQGIMMECSPHKGGDVLAAGTNTGSRADVLFHSGTYNGHPVALAAGLATIRYLEEPGKMDQLLSNTQLLRNFLEEVYHRHGLSMRTSGLGSIFNIVLSNEPVANHRDMWRADTALRKKIDEALLRFGIYVKPLNRYSLSTAHTQEDIFRTVEAHEHVLKGVIKGGF